MHQFNLQQKSTAAQTLDQQRQATLNGYFDDLSTLVLQYDLPKSKPDNPIRAIAKARTFTAVRDLDGDRKGTLIRFLAEADLITGPNPVVNLQGADLNGADFPGAASLNRVNLSNLGLSNATLIGAVLHGADLHGSILLGSNLSGAQLTCLAASSNNGTVCADLSGTDLSGAELSGADLSGAQLTCLPPGSNGALSNCADLSGADLSGAYLSSTALSGANLSGADLSGADLIGANLHGATYNSRIRQATDALGESLTEEPTRWPQGFDPKAAGAICVDC